LKNATTKNFRILPGYMKTKLKTVHFLYFFSFTILIFSGSCKKDDTATTPVYDSVKQAAIDDSVLNKYFNEKGLKGNVNKTPSGLYYKITKQHADSLHVNSGQIAFVRYKLFLLDSTLIESNVDDAQGYPYTPGSSSVIPAWQEGIPLFRKGEEGYLYVPSVLGYKNVGQSKFPANTCLIFFIRIANIEK